ncbi:MAG: hypothetical protein R3F49_03800 [Planctomycetota bacterium]
MHAPNLRTASLSLFAALAVGCVDNSGSGASAPPVVNQGPAAALNGIDTDADGDGDGIVDLPATVPALIGDVFDRYSAIPTANGGRVHLLAQAGVDDRRLIRAREVLRQHLTDVPGSAQGADKRAVADAMSNRGATLVIFQSPATANPALPAVAAFLAAFDAQAWGLIQNTIVIEGSPEYMAASPAIDNTFGATAALVHRTGFATARPAHFAAARSMMEAAIAAGRFTPPNALPASDFDDAYVGLLLDVHSGVWAHDPLGNGRAGTTASYAFASRPSMQAGDPSALAWIEAFFAPQHSYPAQVASTFAGNFDCILRSNLAYTNRSQYLRDVTLTGTNTSEIFGAREATRLVGNAGNNNLKGRAGNDLLISGGGLDTAVFDGPFAEYTITLDGTDVIVTDSQPSRDGTDRLQGFDRLQFTDQGINL